MHKSVCLKGTAGLSLLCGVCFTQCAFASVWSLFCICVAITVHLCGCYFGQSDGWACQMCAGNDDDSMEGSTYARTARHRAESHIQREMIGLSSILDRSRQAYGMPPQCEWLFATPHDSLLLLSVRSGSVPSSAALRSAVCTQCQVRTTSTLVRIFCC